MAGRFCYYLTMEKVDFDAKKKYDNAKSSRDQFAQRGNDDAVQMIEEEMQAYAKRMPREKAFVRCVWKGN